MSDNEIHKIISDLYKIGINVDYSVVTRPCNDHHTSALCRTFHTLTCAEVPELNIDIGSIHAISESDLLGYIDNILDSVKLVVEINGVKFRALAHKFDGVLNTQNGQRPFVFKWLPERAYDSTAPIATLWGVVNRRQFDQLEVVDGGNIAKAYDALMRLGECEISVGLTSASGFDKRFLNAISAILN